MDSTHVAKTGSDVNTLIFDILPGLNEGVYVHFHDIYYAFEYPREWILQGRAWNEAYMLRAFLQYNDTFQICCWNSYLGAFHSEEFREVMPLFARQPGSGLWLRKRRYTPACASLWRLTCRSPPCGIEGVTAWAPAATARPLDGLTFR
ncbi:MAG: hypothetical protein WKF37_14215 [Bryobacteraceae bacterium]